MHSSDLCYECLWAVFMTMCTLTMYAWPGLESARLEPSSCTCHPQSLWYMLFPTLTFWASCLCFQAGTTAPFCAIHTGGECVIVPVRLARLWQSPVLHPHMPVGHGLAQ